MRELLRPCDPALTVDRLRAGDPSELRRRSGLLDLIATMPAPRAGSRESQGDGGPPGCSVPADDHRDRAAIAELAGEVFRHTGAATS
jgi:hypothetical protein